VRLDFGFEFRVRHGRFSSLNPPHEFLPERVRVESAASRYMVERGISNVETVHICGDVHPAVGEERSRAIG